MEDTIEILTFEIAEAAKKSFIRLFENGESYYYCTLVTTGDGVAPVLSAWSWEALEREANKQKQENPKDYAEIIKWSYADSPYHIFGEENFENVRKMFSKRPSLNPFNQNEWNEELNMRLKAMELAMKKIDNDGIFALNQQRDEVCVMVEIMPPDETNTERALRLNKPESKAIKKWLIEAAE